MNPVPEEPSARTGQRDPRLSVVSVPFNHTIPSSQGSRLTDRRSTGGSRLSHPDAKVKSKPEDQPLMRGGGKQGSEQSSTNRGERISDSAPPGRSSLFHTKMQAALGKHKLVAPPTVMTTKSANVKVHLTQQEKDHELLLLAEAALESDNLVPLVRFVFEGRLGPGQQRARQKDASQDSSIEQKSSLLACQSALRKIQQQESSIINEWCSKNSHQMGTALESVATISEQADMMGSQLVKNNRSLQDAGGKLVQDLTELHDAVRVAANVTLVTQSVDGTLQVVRRLVEAVQHVQNDALLRALSIVQSIRNDDHRLSVYPLPPREESEYFKNMSVGQYSLFKLTSKAVNSLHETIQEQAQRNFNEWLDKTRRCSKMIGDRAVRRAAARRVHEDVLARERKTLQGLLLENRDVRAGKQLVLKFIANEDPVHGRGSTKHKSTHKSTAHRSAGLVSSTASLLERKLQQHGSVTGSGRSVNSEDADYAVNLMEGVDMTGLHRCVHIHLVLGAMPAFREYYFEQRRLQLLSDLAPPPNVLEVHRTFLAQLIGFFITEEKVMHSTHDLITSTQVVSLWQIAVSSIKSTLDSAFDGIRDAAAMTLVKDFVALAASTLSNQTFDVTPMMDILLMNRERYHDMLNAEVAGTIKQAMMNLQPAQISTEQELDAYIVSTGLPHSMDATVDDPPPALPFEAPFSAGLPSILSATEGYIYDSVQFHRGLMPTSDLLSATRETRDRFVSRLLVELMLNRVNKLVMNDEDPIVPLMMMASNAFCVMRVVDNVEDFTVVLARGSGDTADKDLQLAARGQRRPTQGPQSPTSSTAMSTALAGGFASFQKHTGPMIQAVHNALEKIQQHIHEATAAMIHKHIIEASHQDWAPESAYLSVASSYLENLFIKLQEALSLSEKHLPGESRRSFVRSAYFEIDSELTCLLVSDEQMLRWNMHGMRRMRDDLEALNQFFARSSAGLDNVLSHLNGLCNFLLSDDWHMVQSPKHLRLKYPFTDFLQVAAVLRKYHPVKLSYIERMRTNRVQPWPRSDVLGLAKDIEAAAARGEFGFASAPK